MTAPDGDAACNGSLAELGARLRAGETTSVALTEAFLGRIAARDGALNAFIRVEDAQARAEAKAADQALAAGCDLGPLHGIPYAVKDVFDTAGRPTTCHSRLRLHAIATHDAALVARLRAGGGVLLGKLATHEFALGGPSFDLPFPPARNPWNIERIPGGSSSGPAAAVAGGLAPFALGTDTLGSIRGPAAYCGVVGLKPTYGALSCDGVFPLAPSLDTCGPLAPTVGDVELVFKTLAPSTYPMSPRPADPERGARIGVLHQFFIGDDRLSPAVADAFECTLRRLAEGGADLVEVAMPDYALFNACGRLILHAEAFAIHKRDLALRPDAFAAATRKALSAGQFLSAEVVARMQELRMRLRDAVDAALDDVDALLTVAALTPAPRFDDPPTGRLLDPPLQNIPFSVTGHPALSVPAGFSPDNLPLAVQVIARRFDEAAVLRIGAAVEACWPQQRRPPLSAGAL